MSSPFELLAAPFTAYVAAVGTAFPDVDEAPSASWFKIGTSGADNYNEDGVAIKHEQTIETFRGLGKTGQLKAWRTEEALKVGFGVHDVTAEQYGKMLNDATVTDVAAGSGTPGYRYIELQQGLTVALFALVLRADASPYGDSWKMQYQVPIVFQSEEPEPTYTKGEPAGLDVEYTALQHSTLGFGRLVIQDATAA